MEETASGEEAIERSTAQPADVVLIDIMLPGHGRLRAVPLPAAQQRRADRHGHGPRRHPRRRRRPRGRRRRLPDQAVRAEGAVGPDPGAAAAGPAGRSRATPASRSAISRSSPTRARCSSAGAEIHLTKTEFRLLCELASNPGRVFSREMLLDRVWGYGYFGDGRLVDVHVRRLRTKVEVDPANPRHVVTVRGLGLPPAGVSDACRERPSSAPRRCARLPARDAPRPAAAHHADASRSAPARSCRCCSPATTYGLTRSTLMRQRDSAILRQAYQNARIVQNELRVRPDLGVQRVLPGLPDTGHVAAARSTSATSGRPSRRSTASGPPGRAQRRA